MKKKVVHYYIQGSESILWKLCGGRLGRRHSDAKGTRNTSEVTCKKCLKALEKEKHDDAFRRIYRA